MVMLAGPIPAWARNVAAAIVGAAIIWLLAGRTLVVNRRKLDALWYARGLALLASTVAMVGFFSRLFGSDLQPFFGYSVLEPHRIPVLGYMTMGSIVAVMVLVFLTHPTRTGLHLAAFQALLGALGGIIWVSWIMQNAQSLAYGTYLMEGGFAGIVLAALWQFKAVGDRMAGPEGPASTT